MLSTIRGATAVGILYAEEQGWIVLVTARALRRKAGG